MKKAITVITTLFSICLTTYAQDVKSVLWKVEHPKTATTSYLVGTLHMICADDFNMPQKITQAVGNVDQVILEVNLTDPAEMQAMQAATSTAEPISKTLTADQLKSLNEKLGPLLGMPVETFDAYGLMMLFNFSIIKTLACTDIKSYETEIIQLALQNELPIKSLENVKQQLEVMNQSYSTADLYQQLLSMNQYGQDFNQAIQHYLKEDLAETVRLISQDAYMTPVAKKVMVHDRNHNWITQLDSILPNQKTLVAVGAAHLVGSNGLIELLRAKGYKVTAVN